MRYFYRVIFVFLLFLSISTFAQIGNNSDVGATSVKLDVYNIIQPLLFLKPVVLNLEVERVLNPSKRANFTVGSNFTFNLIDLKENEVPSISHRTGISPFARVYVRGNAVSSGGFVGFFTSFFVDRGLRDGETVLESDLGIAPGVVFGYKYHWGKMVFQSSVGYGLNVFYKTGFASTISDVTLMKVGIAF